MDSNPLDRRQFNNQLLGAAFGGLIAGSTLGCSEPKASGSAPAADVAADAAPAEGEKKDDKKAEKHACRGLNACKGQAVDMKNACAGQGICANVKHHSCGGQNECKNLGGCGKSAGANECKGQGGCSVPMHTGAWETARKHFETRMTKAGKKFGPAPAAPKPKE